MTYSASCCLTNFMQDRSHKHYLSQESHDTGPGDQPHHIWAKRTALNIFCLRNYFMPQSQFCSPVRSVAKSNYQLLHVCPSACMKHLDSHRMDLHEIWHFRIFRKSLGRSQVWLQSDKNKWYFTWRQIYLYLIISRSVLLRMRNVSDKSCRENQNTFDAH